MKIDYSISLVPIDVCLPPHRISHPDKVIDLANDFLRSGWDVRRSILVGYHVGSWSTIQLLSGSHRYEAAKLAGLTMIPVTIYSVEVVWKAWGNVEEWNKLMEGKL
jgi:ParB-like chromosome segregation protein Spo0J